MCIITHSEECAVDVTLVGDLIDYIGASALIVRLKLSPGCRSVLQGEQIEKEYDGFEYELPKELGTLKEVQTAYEELKREIERHLTVIEAAV